MIFPVFNDTSKLSLFNKLVRRHQERNITILENKFWKFES